MIRMARPAIKNVGRDARETEVRIDCLVNPAAIVTEIRIAARNGRADFFGCQNGAVNRMGDALAGKRVRGGGGIARQHDTAAIKTVGSAAQREQVALRYHRAFEVGLLLDKAVEVV